MRFPGYVSPAQAAERLHVNRKTILAWAHESLEDEDDDEAEPPRFPGVTQTASGRILIPVNEVRALLPRRRR